jgi:hypothetical protein
MEITKRNITQEMRDRIGQFSDEELPNDKRACYDVIILAMRRHKGLARYLNGVIRCYDEDDYVGILKAAAMEDGIGPFVELAAGCLKGRLRQRLGDGLESDRLESYAGAAEDFLAVYKAVFGNGKPRE